MRYSIAYRADGWQPIVPGQPRRGAWQVVIQPLPEGQRLYVELWHYPWADVQVSVAHIEAPVPSRQGAPSYRTVKIVRPEALELVEIPAASEP